MFTRDDLAQLRFLEGRWKGTGPDGAAFYERYDFPDPATLRSRRYADAGFSAPQDGSTVAYADGEVRARWGEFTWRAVELSAGRACFAPANAPSSFCWERRGPASVAVVQRWTDAAGAEQAHTMTLERLPEPDGR